MMTSSQLYTQISSLPVSLQKEVADFIDFLKSRQKSKTKIKERKFGCAKGLFIMHPDFDAPVEDFAEYQ